MTILREHPAFKKLQKVILGKKIVLIIENIVVVPYGSNKAVINTIFISAKPTCSNSMPKWTNVCKVTEDSIVTETKIGEEEKEEVMRQLRF